MIYRFIHSIWKFFWTTVGILLAAAVLIGGLTIAALQLPPAKNFIKGQLTESFNQNFEGELKVESLSGFLPFRAELHEVELYSGADDSEPELKLKSVTLSVNLWELARKNVEVISFDLYEPEARIAVKDDELTIAAIFRPVSKTALESELFGGEPFFRQFHFFAPVITINDGTLYADDSITLPGFTGINSPFIVGNINSELLFENTANQFFINLLQFTAEIPGSDQETVHLTGQLFNDGNLLELNGVELRTAAGSLRFNGEAAPVDLFSGKAADQAIAATYRFELQNAAISSAYINKLVPEPDIYPGEVELQFLLSGNLDSLWVDRFELYHGQSSILADGLLTNIAGRDFGYDMQLENVVIDKQELSWYADKYKEDYNFQALESSVLRGKVHGSIHKTNAELDLNTALGSIYINGEAEHADRPAYELLIHADSLQLSPFLNDTTSQNTISGMLTARGSGFDKNADVAASLHLSSGVLRNHPFNRAVAEVNYSARQLDYTGWLEMENSEITTGGNIKMDEGYISLVSDGSVRNLNLTDYTEKLPYQNSIFSGRYSTNAEGKTIDDFFGRISVEISEAIIDNDTLRPHQLYFDIDSPENETRNLRFTSSFLDAELTGTIKPGLIQSYAKHWYDYFGDRISEEIIFDEELIVNIPDPASANLESEESLNLSTQIRIRDLELLRYYLPELPQINSNARLSASVNATKTNIYVTSNISDSKFTYNGSEIEGLNSSLTASFNYANPLRSESLIDFQLNGNNIIYNDSYNFKEAYVNLSMRNDSISVEHYFGTPEDDITYRSTFNSVLFSDRIEISIDSLHLGTPGYKWKNIGSPEIIINDNRSVTVGELVMTSGSDYVEINGTFSESYEDSVDYFIRDFDIGRISDLVDGRIRFSGIMNGEFVTRSLTDMPSIQGELSVVNGRINERVIGDVSLVSEFNPDLNRFDTNIHVFTDPENYSSYLENNNNIGNDLYLEGYFKIPEGLNEEEDFFYFDADLREIDMWIVTFIVPTIVVDMNGKSSGNGFIRGSRNDYDFSATFDIQDVYGVPVFMNVGYTMNGELVFNRADGLLFNDIELTDSYGGSGFLYGQIDLDDFSPNTVFNLNLDLNNLQFMNNPPDREIPFYASLFGTGSAQLSGTNLNPFIRTTQSISLSSNSRISVPLREEAEFGQDGRFIQFVDSFELNPEKTDNNRNEIGRINDLNGNQANLTFIELFTMDLQFTANNPVNVELIFDPVTNEILNASGTGQLRLLLQDQDVNMFGRFNIQGGEYQFVGGDIFTRRFTLREGGNISWQGDLENANLNVTAAYRARPDISILLPSITTFQRVPIELILQIGGTISAIENEFYFTVPTGIEGTVDPTIASQINTLNQNEDEKVLQAFSILLTGNFLPSDQAQTLGLGENVTGTTALVNPLISSQIISPLLSNQINSLLNSDIVFDVDVNLTRNRIAGDEGDQFGVDLDVALRLFDDRIILRREGQITGQQSNIGDLGATYRINRILSVTAFHRQDPTLATRTDTDSRQTQEMNGVGLEAQFQFNTWQSLRNRVSDTFKKLFGIKEDQPEDQKETDPLAD